MKDYRDKYDDGDIAFYVQVFQDYSYAEACLKQLRRWYPKSRVIIISDGDDDPRYEQLAARYEADYSLGTALYPVENGGRMNQRMLEAFLMKPCAYLIKIDTDTRVHRRFRYLPKGRCVFGTLEWETSHGKIKLEFPNVQGGCMGFTLESAREIAESGILLSRELLDYRQTYADNPDIIYRAEKKGLISMDFVMRYACRQLNVPLVSFDEVHSLYRGDIALTGGGYAITHPHKHTEDCTYRNQLKRSLRHILKKIVAPTTTAARHRPIGNQNG
ncbi:MAG: hypothetical protein WKF30_07045 [Pyrinomonadaceae bacterium]